MYFKLSSALVVKFGQDMASSSMRQTKQAELILNLQSYINDEDECSKQNQIIYDQAVPLLV
jgi:hypothetical protein